MSNTKNHLLKLSLAVFVVAAALFVGCKNSPTEQPGANYSVTDKAALEKITYEDSALSSFEPNYNEDGLMEMTNPSVLGLMTSDIFPIKVGRQITSVVKTFTVNQLTDTTAEGKLIMVFTGNFLIGLSHDTTTRKIDSVISKPFETTVERNIKFVKVANTEFPKLNWKVSASSVTTGGTKSSNVSIKRITVYLPSGDSLSISDPLNYYFSHGFGKIKQIPTISMNQDVTIKVEVFSSYQAEDFVAINYGGDMKKNHRAKQKFALISDDGLGNKVYTNTYRAHPFMGRSHTVLDVMPAQVINDAAAPFESTTWGFPYIVH